MNPAEQLADWINWTLKNKPEAVKAEIDGKDIELHLWGGSLVLSPDLQGGGTYYVNDTSGG